MRVRELRRAALAVAAVALNCACRADAPREPETRALPPSPAPPLGDVGLSPARKPATQEDSGSASAAAAPRQVELGSAAGVPITMEELVLAWHEVSAREVGLVVEKLLATRFAFAEAARLGLEVDAARADEAVARRRADLEREAAGAEGTPTLDEYVARRFDMEASIYFERMRSAALRQSVAEQAIRAWTLGNPTREVRILTVDREEDMREIEEAARAGADFAELARNHSTDETAASGGLVPFVVREERSPLARIAFATPVGEIGGPVWVGGHGFLVRVESERSPWLGSGASLVEAVAASLAEHPVTDAEFIHWKVEMESVYPVDLEPLRRLLGAPQTPPRE